MCLMIKLSSRINPGVVAIECGRDVDIKSEVKLPSIYSLHLAWPGDADIAVPAQLDMRRVRGIAPTPGSGPVRGNADLDTEGLLKDSLAEGH